MATGWKPSWIRHLFEGGRAITDRARKLIQRSKFRTAAAAAILLTLIGGVIATTWRAHRAELAKTQAQKRFNLVHQPPRSDSSNYREIIKDLPGATRPQRSMRNGLTSDENVAGITSNPDLQPVSAVTKGAVSEVDDKTSPRETKVVTNYEPFLYVGGSSVVITDFQNRRDAASRFRRIGNQLLGMGRVEEAIAQLEQALTLYTGLAAERPDQPDIQRDLAETHNDLGRALETHFDFAAALEHYDAARAIYERLLAQNPQDQATRVALSIVYDNIGRVQFHGGRAAEALETNEKVVALRKALLVEDPANSDYRRMLATSYQTRGDYLDASKRTQDALDTFREKLAIDEQSVAADPVNAQALSGLAYSGKRMGDLSADLADYKGALPYYQRAVESYEKIRMLDPRDSSITLQLSRASAKLAKTQAKLGNIAAARAAGRKATDLLLASAADVNNEEQRRTRASVFGEIAEAYVVLAGDKEKSSDKTTEFWLAARGMYQRSLEIMKDLRDRDHASEIEGKIAQCDGAYASMVNGDR